MDVVSKHPRRLFVTSASRQAPKTSLVRAVGDELERVNSDRLSRLIGRALDDADYAIFGGSPARPANTQPLEPATSQDNALTYGTVWLFYRSVAVLEALAAWHDDACAVALSDCIVFVFLTQGEDNPELRIDTQAQTLRIRVGKLVEVSARRRNTRLSRGIVNNFGCSGDVL